jgi:YD repeat-containing protein
MERDHQWHQKFFSYGDSYADGVNRNTFAYPTAITDQDNNNSYVQYDYHRGMPTRRQDPKGAVRTMQYDAAGRLERATNVTTGAYMRWVYPSNFTYVQQFSTVNNVADETYSNRLLDGFGRTHSSATGHPYSAGGYKAVLSTYDVMGRLVSESNPTEIDGNWNPYGDDAAGWRYKTQTYDWQGRPLVTTNTDSTTRQVSYDGCGCAGSQTETTTDEVGRRTRVSFDVLGRLWKTEVLNTDGSVYRSMTNTIDALDHVTRIDDVAVASGVTQVTLMTYDGHGRLKTRKLPEATSPVTFNYNSDDTMSSETDGRGAVTTYGYNGRHLVTSASSSYGGSTVSRSFQYDAAGNRTQMNDGQGWQTYTYNTASQLTSESRYFYALGISYNISYTYNLAGQVKSVTDPFNSTVYYGYDNEARLENVTGTPFAGVTTYASAIRYRAWGGVKSASFGDNSYQTTSYNGQMRPTQYRLSGTWGSWQRLDYSYYGDGRLSNVVDLDDGQGSNPPSTLHFMSRSYTYDHVGRVTFAGGTSTTPPFRQWYSYNEFDNTTSRSGSNGYNGAYLSDTATYTNNRRDGWTYDADGRLTYSPANSSSPSRTWNYDAAGALVSTVETVDGTTNTLTLSYDGDGKAVREARTGYSPVTYYMVRSTVLKGEVLTRVKSNGGKEITYIQASGVIFPRQTINSYDNSQYMSWTHRDPPGITEPGATYDPLGNYIPHVPPQPYQPPSSGYMYGPSYGGASSSFGNANNLSTGCTLDGTPWSCNSVLRILQNGGAGRGTVISTTGGMPSIINTIGFIPSYSTHTYRTGPPTVTRIDPDTGRTITFHGWGRVVTVVVVTWVPVVGNQQVTPVSPGGTPLSTKDEKKHDDAQNKLLNGALKDDKKKKTDCEKFLEEKGISLGALREHVSNQRPFDATRTTQLTAYEAGIAPGRAGIGALPVNEFFKRTGADAAASTFRGASFDVYFKPSAIDTSSVLHEALHTLLDLNDSDLAFKLGLTTKEGGKLEELTASSKISPLLRQKGCK